MTDLNMENYIDVRSIFSELSEEERNYDKTLTEIDGLVLYNSKLRIETLEQLEMYKDYISKFDEAISSNVQAVMKIENYKETNPKLNNKMLISDGFKAVKLGHNTYYYNLMPVYTRGKEVSYINKKARKELFNQLESLSEEEFNEKKSELVEYLNKNTRTRRKQEPKFKGFVIELIAVVKPK